MITYLPLTTFCIQIWVEFLIKVSQSVVVFEKNFNKFALYSDITLFGTKGDSCT